MAELRNFKTLQVKPPAVLLYFLLIILLLLDVLLPVKHLGLLTFFNLRLLMGGVEYQNHCLFQAKHSSFVIKFVRMTLAQTMLDKTATFA
jgi:hypothetical protein